MPDAKSPPDLSMDEILATIRRIITDDEQAGGPSTGSAAAGTDDVLELTEALNEDGTTRHLAPIGSSSRQVAGLRAPPSAGSPPEPEPQRREAPIRRPAPGQAAAADERLVSDVASFAAAAAFARLATVRRAPREPPMVGDRTLDDVVRDLLRPLLQTWLDENLPDIVERLVQAEIARIVG